ncbi:MAG: ABC transporter permease subunit [Eubacteriales bacterium]
MSNIKSKGNVINYRKSNKITSQLSLFMLCLPAVICTIIWGYVPLSGLVLAFKRYNFKDGVFGSAWCGLDNFDVLFKSNDMGRIIRNTVGYASLNIVLSIVCGVILALLLFEIKSKMSIKIIQTLAILPRFLSWVVVGFVTYACFEINNGVFNQIRGFFGAEPLSWYTTPEVWLFIIPFMAIWKKIGIDAIMYYAALMSVDAEQFEAADLDGASKLQKIWYISIPSIKGIIIILLILSLGSIFRGDFGLFYQIPRNSGSIYATTDVIDTYIYRGLKDGSYAMSTAVGLVQSVVGFVCIVAANLIVRKVDPEASLF